MLGRLLVRAAAVSGVLGLLRPRWKWLAGCVGAGLLAHYLYADYTAHVRLLADMGAVDDLSGQLSVAFVGKNAVIVGLVVAYLWFEARLARRPRTAGSSAARREESGVTASAKAGRAPDPRTQATNQPSTGSDEAATHPGADDGFDFLRHGRKLETRSQKLMRRR